MTPFATPASPPAGRALVAEIVAIGTELLLGEIVDTNSSWLARRLAGLGVDVYWSHRVGDNRQRLVSALSQALERSDLVIACGGLGPTEDDLTREAIAEVVGETPCIDPAQEAHLRDMFAAYGLPMPEANLKQAWRIPSGEILANPIGSAPGWWVGAHGRFMAALPGPPHEMQRMWLEQVEPRLPGSGRVLFRKTFKIFALGESAVAELLGELTRQANPSVATYAHADGIHVRVAASAPSAEQAERLAVPALQRVQEALGASVWGTDEDTLPALVHARLKEQGQTLCTAETSAGGQLCPQLLAVPGIGEVYRGGLVACHPEVARGLGVPVELITRCGLSSREVAVALAASAARQYGSHYALAVTGTSGPDGVDGGPPGRIHVALATPHGTDSRQYHWPRHPREEIQKRAAAAALRLLLHCGLPHPRR